MLLLLPVSFFPNHSLSMCPYSCLPPAVVQGGVGAYTDSRGNPLVREEVARFIEKRDGVPSNPDVSETVCVP